MQNTLNYIQKRINHHKELIEHCQKLLTENHVKSHAGRVKAHLEIIASEHILVELQQLLHIARAEPKPQPCPPSSADPHGLHD